MTFTKPPSRSLRPNSHISSHWKSATRKIPTAGQIFSRGWNFAARFFPVAGILFAATLRADDTGELLIGGLNCSACHQASETALQRLCVGRPPKISGAGAAVTPQWLREFLDNPQKMKPGTSMPDMLTHLSGAERAETIEALTHYILSVRSNSTATVEAVPADIKRGGELFHQYGCVACHAPANPPSGRADDDAMKAEIAKLASESVGFPYLEKKFTVPDLADFIRNPVKAHPAGTMPSLGLDKEAARKIALWLLRGQLAGDDERKQGLTCDYYDRPLGELSMFENAAPASRSLVDDVSTDPAPHNHEYALRFRGFISIPRDGEYTFYTHSDDGSWLLINGKLVVDNSGYHADQEVGGKITLTAGDHTFTVCHFQGTGESALGVRWEGPDIQKQEIPKSAYFRRNLEMRPRGASENPFEPDEAKVETGKKLFASLNCAVCHPQSGEAGVMSTKSLADLAGQEGGCLSATPAPGLPRYTLVDSSRAAIKASLANAKGFSKPLPPAAQLHRTLTALNCYACHARNGTGGPQGFRREYFLTNDGKRTDDAKRLPPTLDGLGTKHDADWIRRALEEPGRGERMTRMPEFGEAANGLPELFIKTDTGPK